MMEVKVDIREFSDKDKLIIIGEKGRVVIQNLDGFPANRVDNSRFDNDLKQRRAKALSEKKPSQMSGG